MTTSHPLLRILDCPACRSGSGLVPQSLDGQSYLACALCCFWYPIRDEVIVLFAPERNPEGLRRPLEAPAPFPIERREPRFVDMKALVYGYYVPMHEFGTAFRVHEEPVVVDIGCSTGSFAAWLRPDQTYIGIDASLDSLRFARQGSGQFFVQADAERLPLKSASVPFFVSREVLEHLNDPLAGAKELCRMGCRGVIAVPTLDFPFLYDPVNWVLIRRHQRARFGIYGYGHQEVLDIAGWRRLLEKGGLALKKEQPIGTGLWLNASDNVWHAVYSWREFDSLPRRGAPIALARAMFRVRRAFHRIDGKLYSRRTLSHAFEVTPRGTG